MPPLKKLGFDHLPDELPDPIAELVKTTKAMMREKSHLCGACRHLSEPDDLQPYVQQIMSLGRSIRSNLLRIDVWNETGKDPHEQPLPDFLALDRELRNNRSYISRYGADKKKQEQVQKRTARNKEIMNILAQHGR